MNLIIAQFGRFKRNPRIKKILQFLVVMGPGLVAANAGNDSGGIATYSAVGAQFGMQMLWILFVVTFSLVIVQLMCARLGVYTHKGLADLIREQFGVKVSSIVMLSFIVASLGTTTAEFAGIAAGLELFGISKYLSVPISAIAIWWLVTRGSFKSVERVFLLMTFVFFAYPIAAILSHPNWNQVAMGTFIPTFSLDRNYLFMVITLIGTTITSYMQFFLQASIAEKGINEEEYQFTKFDVIFSAIFADAIAFFIIVATGASLHPRGIVVDSAQDAAQALAPIAGRYAEALFAFGFVGASLLAAGVLPLASAYALAEAFGFERGVSHRFSDAPIFNSIFMGMLGIGALVVLIPNVPLINILIVSQFIDGFLLPILLVAITKLCNRRELLGNHVNGPVFNLIAWTTTVVLTLLSILLIISMVLPNLFTS